jgi:hypothetical protein
MRKTFKIGECAVGGIIEIKINNSKTLIEVRNATWEENKTIEIRQFRWELDSFKLELYLNELTTSYYASKIRDWVTINAGVRNAFAGRS